MFILQLTKPRRFRMIKEYILNFNKQLVNNSIWGGSLSVVVMTWINLSNFDPEIQKEMTQVTFWCGVAPFFLMVALYRKSPDFDLGDKVVKSSWGRRDAPTYTISNFIKKGEQVVLINSNGAEEQIPLITLLKDYKKVQ